jgi:hypothetical protein
MGEINLTALVSFISLTPPCGTRRKNARSNG